MLVIAIEKKLIECGRTEYIQDEIWYH